MTKKEIKELAKEMLVQMNITPLDVDVAMDDHRLHMTQVDWDYISMTEEEELLSELAKLMTLMNLYTDKEEYEKCSLLKARIRDIKNRLKEHEDDEK